jgi:malate dehydrogenase (oxaloacetate-decarboxylating)(NADP+)
MPIKKYVDPLSYHAEGKPGKIEVVTTKPANTQSDLAMAYSPGVAEPCLAIAKNTEDVYKYTAKGNLVAVISNGSAVLGLGDIGPEASKPVMEGKGVLFKIFSDIDVFDIELNCKSVDDFCNTVKAMEPTFGGINLEDIKAPESFEIEERLKKEMNIPVMHDDQHGTAIISGAGLLSALKIVNKKIGVVKLVVNGAGASAIACTKLFISLGVKKTNILMLDSKGVLTDERQDLDKYKAQFAIKTKKKTLDEAIKKADVFVGLSRGNILTPKMIKSMAKKPIVFAMANPTPEIDYNLAVETRSDIVMATGRSDYPNQVNNVLGFPFIFRGALDVRATEINEEMKLAAVKAIAELAQEPVPEVVMMAYNDYNLSFGRDYIIPKPMDPRLLTSVAPAVAKAAMDSGVAKSPIKDWNKYRAELRKRLGMDNDFVNRLISKAKRKPMKVVFAEAHNPKILKAAHICETEGIAIPILLGDKDNIATLTEEHNLEFKKAKIIDPWEDEKQSEKMGKELYKIRYRKGLTEYEAIKNMRNRNYFGCMLVKQGKADSIITGLTRNYPIALRPAIECIGTAEGVSRVMGMHVLMTKRGPLFLADTTVNINYTKEQLVELVLHTHKKIKHFGIKPVIAICSYSNFGSSVGDLPKKIQAAIEVLHTMHPEIEVEGEMQVGLALDGDTRIQQYAESKIGSKNANTLIFPDLNSGNAAYQLIRGMGTTEAIGPILMGFKKSAHIIHPSSTVREIVNLAAVAVCDAQDA